MQEFFMSPYFWLGLIIFLLGLLVVESIMHRRATARPKKRTGVTVEQRRATFDPSSARVNKKK